MAKREIANKVRAFAKLVCKELGTVKCIILYGSYARGDAHKHSDIDVAIVTSGLKENILEVEGRLFKLRRKIDLRIEPVIIDENNDPAGFLDELMNTGEIIYKKAA